VISWFYRDPDAEALRTFRIRRDDKDLGDIELVFYKTEFRHSFYNTVPHHENQFQFPILVLSWQPFPPDTNVYLWVKIDRNYWPLFAYRMADASLNLLGL